MPRAANGSLLDLTDIPAMRAQLSAVAEQLPRSAPDPAVGIGTVRVPRADGCALDVVLFRPEGSGPLPVVVYFHAGGQVLGSAHDDTDYPGALALALDSAVAVVDYRLAPETPAPGAAEDGYLAAHAAQHGIDPARMGIAGASGGGAVALATALMVRDRGAVPPCLWSLN